MLTKPFEEKHARYGRNDGNMMTTVRCEIKHLIAENVDLIYALQPQAEVQNKVQEAHVSLLQLGKNVKLNGIKPAFARLLERKVIEFSNFSAAYDVLSQ